MKIHVTPVVALLVACGAGADETELAIDPQKEVSDEDSLDGEVLKVGSSGPEVVTANRYFMRYGYFANEELRRQHPRWQPVIGQPPADDGVFGAELEAAVSAFQARSGLPVTGAIDAATRKVMAM